MISIRGEHTYQFRGLSTDKKPVNNYIDNGSIFIEMDTSIIYTFDKKNKEWLVLDWNTAASQEEFDEFKEEVENEIEDLKDLIATDVKEIVGSYEELETYVQEHLDTLKVDDKIEVLVDETEEGTNTVYRYLGNGEVELIGRLGPYYTKSEVDEKFALKADDTTPVVPKPDPEDPSIVVPDNDELAFTVSQKVIDPETGEESYQSFALNLDDLRQRILSSTDNDATDFENAENGQFIYEEITDEEEGN